jgi:hypothetical protein
MVNILTPHKLTTLQNLFQIQPLALHYVDARIIDFVCGITISSISDKPYSKRRQDEIILPTLTQLVTVLNY